MIYVIGIVNVGILEVIWQRFTFTSTLIIIIVIQYYDAIVGRCQVNSKKSTSK